MQRSWEKKNPEEMEFFTDHRYANRYKILKLLGQGSYGIVCAAIDEHTGEKVAIKKVTSIFEHKRFAIRILREIKLLRLLKHPDIVEIKSILIPPSCQDFKEIYIVLELLESDLQDVIETNIYLTSHHHRLFLYQILRAMKFMHSANVFHRDLKPTNILANVNSKLKVCDFGLSRVSSRDSPAAIMGTDYIVSRWYRAPELCGKFSSKYTPAIDIWSIGCIFAEVLIRKPLFPGETSDQQLELITDFLGTPSPDTIARIENKKSRKRLAALGTKQPMPFAEKFPNADPEGICLLQKLLAFDPIDRPTAEQALADPYFKGLAEGEREPSSQPIPEVEFAFEGEDMTIIEIKELIYREILEYHPQLLRHHMAEKQSIIKPLYPSVADQVKSQSESGLSVIRPSSTNSASRPRYTVPPKPMKRGDAFDNEGVLEEVHKKVRADAINTLPPPHWMPSSGGAVARVQAHEISGRIACDARSYGKNPVLTPSDSPHPLLSSNTKNSTKNKEKPVTEEKIESSSSNRQSHPKQPMQTNVSSSIFIDLNSSPLEHEHNFQENASSSIAIDLNMSPVDKSHLLAMPSENVSSGTIGIDLNKSPLGQPHPPVPENPSSGIGIDLNMPPLEQLHTMGVPENASSGTYYDFEGTLRSPITRLSNAVL